MPPRSVAAVHVRPLAAGRALAALATLTALVACGGGGADQPTAPPTLARLELSATTVTLSGTGSTQNVTVSGRAATGAPVALAAVTWTSSDASVATVSGSGATATITARAPGTAVVSVASGGVTASIAVSVLGVRAVRITPTAATVRAGATVAFTAQVEADAGVPTAVNWSTGDGTIATVDAQGVVTGVSEGTTTVRATATADANVSAVAVVTVTRQQTLSVTPVSLRIGIQEQRPLAAVVDGVPSQDVIWRNDNPNVATVSTLGVVTGVQLGTTTIVAIHPADSTVRRSIPVSVEPVVRGITVTPAAAVVLARTTVQFTADVTADGGVSPAVTWRSSNTGVATVSGTGLVTGVGNGTATISAISVVDTLRRGSATVTVAVGPDAVTITRRDVGLFPGQAVVLATTVTGPPDANRSLSWASSAPGVATVDSTGRVTAVALGSTVVSATSTVDPSRRDTVTVAVVPRVATTWTATRLGGPLIDRIGAVHGVGNGAAYAIDQAGDIQFFNGSTWTRALAGNVFATRFTAVHGSAAGNVIAVGTGGVIVRFTDTGWQRMTSPTTRDLAAVFVTATGSAVAVGSDGVALRLNGETWSTTATGLNSALLGVSTAGTTTFAVGEGGVVLRAVGSGPWERMPVPTTETLRAVHATSPTDVTVVGDFGTILAFASGGWTNRSSGALTDDFRSVSGTSVAGSRVVIGGTGGLYELAGGAAPTPVSSPYRPDAWGVAFDPAGTLWVAGERGMVLREAAGSWTTLSLAPDLLDVWATAPNSAWVVGEFGFLYRWNGASWERQATPTTARLNTVWGAESGTAFAGGDDGLMLQLVGGQWTPVSVPSTADILAIWGANPAQVFAVTAAGEILRFDGSAWAIAFRQAQRLYAVFGTAANDVVAVGDRGTVLRFDGTTWTPQGPEIDATFTGVWVSAAPRTIITVGIDFGIATPSGTAYRFLDGWQRLTLPANELLTSVWGLSRFELFATGEFGTLLRWDGTSWTSVATGTGDFLWSVSGAPSGTGGAFAVGWNGTVVRGGAVAAARAGGAITAQHPSLEPSAAARRVGPTARRVPVGAARGAQRASTVQRRPMRW